MRRGDWLTTEVSAKRLTDRMVAPPAMEEGVIVLEHELSDASVDAFILSYPSLARNGWVSSSVPDLMDLECVKPPSHIPPCPDLTRLPATINELSLSLSTPPSCRRRDLDRAAFPLVQPVQLSHGRLPTHRCILITFTPSRSERCERAMHGIARSTGHRYSDSGPK